MTFINFVLLLCSFSFSTAFADALKAKASLPIITIGHPTLYLEAQKVEQEEIKTPYFQNFLDDMIITMKEARGVGLAAPQVNVSKRFFIVKHSAFTKAQALINPVLEYLVEGGVQISNEGCLSIPGRTFKVERYKEINVKYQDRNGEFHFERFSGFKAIVVQHEYDHLNGILISDIFKESFFLEEDEAPLFVPQM